MNIVVPGSSLTVTGVTFGHWNESDERVTWGVFNTIVRNRVSLNDQVRTKLQVLENDRAIWASRVSVNLLQRVRIRRKPIDVVGRLLASSLCQTLISGQVNILDAINIEADAGKSLAAVNLLVASSGRVLLGIRVTELVDGERSLGVLIHQRGVAGSLADGQVLTFLRNSDHTRGSDTQGEASDGGKSDRTNGQRVLLHWSEFLYISSDWSA